MTLHRKLPNDPDAKPLKRTELRRGTKGLERKPKLQAVDGDKSKPAKRKTAKRTGETEARSLVYARSNGACEVRIDGVCLGRGTNWHHRRMKGQGGRWEASNGLHVCGSGTTGCHGALTNTNGRRAEYEANGWLLREGQHPAEVEVLLARESGRDFYLLDDAGGVQLALFPAPVDAHPDDLDVTRPDQTGDQAA